MGKKWLRIVVVAGCLGVSVGCPFLPGSQHGQVTVPDISGLTLPQAEAALRESGLSLGEIAADSTVSGPPGAVLAQAPAAGARVRPGARVDATVALALPDLEAKDLAVHPQALLTITGVFVSANIYNGSPCDAPSFQWALLLDGEPVRQGDVEQLPSGEEVPVQVSLGRLAAGEHEVELVADPKEALAEEQRANNAQSQAIAVAEVPAPSVELLSPAGGEFWFLGETGVIQWKSSGPVVRIELLDDRGHSTVLHPAALNVEETNSFAWDIPARLDWTDAEGEAPAFSIRLTATADPTLTATSPSRFAITGQSTRFWARAYGPGQATAIRPTPDGGYVVAGSTYKQTNSNPYRNDALVLKTDALGNEVWRKTFMSDPMNEADSIEVCSDGGYIVGGKTGFFVDMGMMGGFVSYRGLTLKLDADGNEVWRRDDLDPPGGYDGPPPTRSAATVEAHDGGFVGLVIGVNTGHLFKFDAAGQVAWESADVAGRHSNLLSTTEGYVSLLAAPSSDSGWGSALMWTDVAGALLAVQPYDDYWNLLRKSASDGYVLASGGTAIRLMKVDAEGVEEWRQTYSISTAPSYTVQEVISLREGGYLLAGGAFLLKADGNGALLWQRRDDTIKIHGMAEADDGYMLAGARPTDGRSPLAASYVYLRKTDELGNGPLGTLP